MYSGSVQCTSLATNINLRDPLRQPLLLAVDIVTVFRLFWTFLHRYLSYVSHRQRLQPLSLLRTLKESAVGGRRGLMNRALALRLGDLSSNISLAKSFFQLGGQFSLYQPKMLRTLKSPWKTDVGIKKPALSNRPNLDDIEGVDLKRKEKKCQF